jgi:uncharacterized repeat protein (TIGR03833 family)
MSNKDGRIRKNMMPGSLVQIVQKPDQKSGRLTKGVVEVILTPGAKHPHGIKVRLKSGPVGRVKKILDPRARGDNDTPQDDTIPSFLRR